MKIEDFLIRNEGKTLEFKRDLSSVGNIIKTITAFANTAGGVILIGVEDVTKAVIGIVNPLDEEERICNIIADSIEPRLVPDIDIINWKGLTLISIKVYPSALRPHWIKSQGKDNGVLVRVGSTNRKADAALINDIRRSALNLSFDEEPIPDINPEALDIRVASGLITRIDDWNENTMESLHLVTRYQGRLVPTVGGVLLFGKVRDKYFPDAWIQCGRFSGKNKSKIIDQIDISNHLPVALSQAYDFVIKHALKSAEFGGLHREDKWNLPLMAIREALTNAIVHADYSQFGSPIRLSIFDDRIEIENPGMLIGGMTINDVYNGVSKLRNRVIGRIFKELKLIEQWGSGYQRMINECNVMNLPEPQCEEIAFSFRVIFSLIPVVNKKVIVNVEEKIIETIFKYDNEGGISTQYLSELIGISTRAMRERLASMVKNGKIIAIGKSAYDPNKRYFVVKK
jgi:ATP-dependent DNA helicase RecG